ncbi:hypothetical protein LIER_27998 [Lithospermum erythrorhizon]|uniref:Uncharacterized protein n=1 Tax=Lithospermum erythrorhizon TaxID=34254 RepID=A0AAV3RE08_LITER
MSLPEVGYVIATRITCLPATVKAGNGPPKSMVVLGHILLGSHFILLHMAEDIDFPINSPTLYWEAHHDQSASKLIAPYRDMIDLFNQIINASKG